MLTRPEWSGLKKLLAVHTMTGAGIVTQDATATGDPATFDTTLIRPLKSCVASFLPVQAGSGTPSPDNVRPISGWTGLTVYHSGEDTSNPDEIAVAWQTEAGTVYGGTVDLVSGVLTVMWSTVDMGTIEWEFRNNNATRQSWRTKDQLPIKTVTEGNDLPHVISTQFATKAITDSWPPYIISYNSRDDMQRIVVTVPSSAYSTGEEVQAVLSGIPLVYELAEPQTVQLTARQIMAIAGTNKIWSNAGENVSVTYVKTGDAE